MYLKCLYYSGKKNLLLKNSTFLNQKIFQTFQQNIAMFLRYNMPCFITQRSSDLSQGKVILVNNSIIFMSICFWKKKEVNSSITAKYSLKWLFWFPLSGKKNNLSSTKNVLASRNIAYLVKLHEILQLSYCEHQYLIFLICFCFE